MSEPFLERLSRFTPDAGRLERDALLFAAGRGSARPNRLWMTLAAVLASTQVLSLVLLWPQPMSRIDGSSLFTDTQRMPRPATESAAPEAPANTGLWTVHQGLSESELEERPDNTVTLIDTEPPLRAFAPPPSSILY
jgi:hypothetical protein